MVDDTNDISHESSCLPSLVNVTPTYLNFSTCFSVAPINLQHALIRVSYEFWPRLFLFPRRRMHLQSYLMRAEGQLLWKKAEPSHERIADDRFENSQSWHTHQHECIGRSNSCKRWKVEVTKRILAGVQHPHGTAVITCYLPEHKPPVGCRMT